MTNCLATSPSPAQGCGGPASYELTGLARDFHEHGISGGHVDFERNIPTGSGLYAGNIDLFLQDGKPVFIGGGAKISIPAMDAEGRNIAAHMANKRYAEGVELVPQATTVILADSDGVDAYELTFISAEFNEDGTSAWTYNVEELPTGKDLSHWLLVLDADHQVGAGTTPGYTLGTDGSTGFYGIKWDVDDAFEEQEFVIVLDQHYLGADSTCSVVAKGGNDHDHGDLFAPTGQISATGSPFPVTPGPALVDDATLEDDEAFASTDSNGGIDSARSFDSWFRDVPPLNMSDLKTITLVRQDDCSYVFDVMTDPDYIDLGGFFPLDGELFGNSGGSPDHNFHFTFEVHATFTYDATADQYVRFEGDDDVWVFIDGKLAIDLGGIHGPLEQWCDLDRMGLTDGDTYVLDLFFAERHRTQSNFLVETNLVLESIDPEMVSAVFD